MNSRRNLLTGIPPIGWVVILTLGICGLCTLIIIIATLVTPFIQNDIDQYEKNSSLPSEEIELDQEVYVANIIEDANVLAMELEEFETLIQDNPEYVDWNSEQLKELNTIASDIKLHYSQLQNIEPPVGYEDVHRKYLIVTLDLYEAMNLAQAGFTLKDITKINAAMEKVTDVKLKLEEITILLD